MHALSAQRSMADVNSASGGGCLPDLLLSFVQQMECMHPLSICLEMSLCHNLHALQREHVRLGASA